MRSKSEKVLGQGFHLLLLLPPLLKHHFILKRYPDKYSLGLFGYHFIFTKKMKAKTFFIWVCGLWSLGLGLRMTLELLVSDSGVYIPKHYLNIYFDFLPLCIFGFIVSVLSTKEIIKEVKKEK